MINSHAVEDCGSFAKGKFSAESGWVSAAKKCSHAQAKSFCNGASVPLTSALLYNQGRSPLGFIPLWNNQSSETPSFSRAASKSTMKPKRTILCVDDNEQSLSIRKVMLETRGYRVITCNGGEQALEIFKKGGIDLVLTDLIMPGLDGTKLVEQVKSISPQTPAILLSGKVKIYDRDTQADVFLPKGMYAPVELLERIRLLLIRKRGPKRAQSRSRSAAQTSAA
jgi:two-component system, OmpR family, response regulator CpxR